MGHGIWDMGNERWKRMMRRPNGTETLEQIMDEKCMQDLMQDLLIGGVLEIGVF